MMNDDRLRDLVERANRDPSNNGYLPVAPERRPSGWVCPVCHTEADQRVEQVMMGGQPVAGAVKWLVLPDGTPQPVAVLTQEVLERDAEHNPTKVYETRHCFNCFNAWQRAQMMRDIRANVPQLERKQNAE